MANILNTTQVYNAADVVTHTNLNQIISGASFVTGTGGTTDDITLEVDATGGFLKVKDIDTAQLVGNSVTLDKIAELAGNRVIGNNTADEANATAITIQDELIVSASTDSVAYSSAITDLVNDLIVKINARTILNYSERIMTRPFTITNNTTPVVPPVSGSANTDSARYLCQDGENDVATTTKALIDDLTLQDTDSKVEITYHIAGDTNNSKVPVNFFLERSLDNGVTFESIPGAIGKNSQDRLRATSQIPHVAQIRNIPFTDFTFIDSPGITTPQYRLTWSILTSYPFHLNKDNTNNNDDGYAILVSYMRTKEIVNTSVTNYGGS
jgi:hypothetical protein